MTEPNTSDNHAKEISYVTFTARVKSQLVFAGRYAWRGRWTEQAGWRFMRVNGRKWRPYRQIPKRIRHLFYNEVSGE